MAGGSAPARNYRGLLRVHVLFGLRFCTSVSPRTSPEASAGRLIGLGCSSGYRANRQFPGRDLHPLDFETQKVSSQSETQLTSDLPSCRTARRIEKNSPPLAHPGWFGRLPHLYWTGWLAWYLRAQILSRQPV